MADQSLNCSISQQDCAKYRPRLDGDPAFTSSSCVGNAPWLKGDTGVCGWKGAPCATLGNLSNCNSPYDFACVTGICLGLGSNCDPPGEHCNGFLYCGSDGFCGGKDAWLYSYLPISSDVAKQRCITGMTYTDTDGSIRCTNPADMVMSSTPTPTDTVIAKPKKSLSGGMIGSVVADTLAGLVFLFALGWCIYRIMKRSAKAPKPTLESGDTQSEKVEPDVFPTGATGLTTQGTRYHQ